MYNSTCIPQHITYTSMSFMRDNNIMNNTSAGKKHDNRHKKKENPQKLILITVQKENTLAKDISTVSHQLHTSAVIARGGTQYYDISDE